MIRTASRLRLCVTLLVINLVFIWGNSLLPGQVSGAISHWVKDLLEAIFGSSGGDPSEGHGLLRKLAHFTEFGCLGACLCWLFSMLSKPWWLSLLCGFSAACVDETIQCFVPDRGPGIKDVMIDTAGVAVGITLLLLGYTIYKKQKSKQILEETKQ